MTLTQHKFTCPKCGHVDQVIIVHQMPRYGVRHQCQKCGYAWDLPEPPLTAEEIEEQQPGYVPER